MFIGNEFKEVPEGTGLFKLAVKNKIDSMTLSPNDIKDLSLKYQVLSKETAFIGVVKENDEVTNDVMEIYKQHTNVLTFDPESIMFDSVEMEEEDTEVQPAVNTYPTF